MLPNSSGDEEAPLRQNRVGKFLALGRRLAAGFPCRVNGVLRLNGADDFRNGDAQLCKLVGLYPKPHRVLAGAEYLTLPMPGERRKGSARLMYA